MEPGRARMMSQSQMDGLFITVLGYMHFIYLCCRLIILILNDAL